MRVLVTGAGGFVGRAVVRLLAGAHEVVASDSGAMPFGDVPGVNTIPGDLSDPALIARLFAQTPNAIIHLATIPGGAAEADPALAWRINVTASMALIEAAAATRAAPRFVFASSVAVFGDPLQDVVDDTTPVRPQMRYGAHKAMIEEWISTMSRRGAIRGLSLRLPGIVARPRGPSGMKSAFISEVFHNLREGHESVLPVPPDATSWMLSRTAVAQHFAHALTLDPLPADARLTLPALRVTMADLVTAVARRTGADPALVRWQPDPAITATFGRHPPLLTPRAEALGFAHDGDVETLVERALADIATTGPIP